MKAKRKPKEVLGDCNRCEKQTEKDTPCDEFLACYMRDYWTPRKKRKGAKSK